MMKPLPHQRLFQSKPQNTGFTYLGLLFMIAMMSIVLLTASVLWSLAQQREKEKQLLFVGHQFRQAIGLYYERTPGTLKKYPATLQDLLSDQRYVNTQRYLREIYRDPMTNQAEWGLITAPQGGVMGVFSLSEDAPVKKAHFRQEDQGFTGARHYKEWQFAYLPIQPVQTNK